MKSFVLALAVAVMSRPPRCRSMRKPDAWAAARGRHAAQHAGARHARCAHARPAPAQPAAPTTAAAPRLRPPPRKRSWMGPIAGLAAGLGIAALMSHLGMGEAFGNILMMMLLAAVAFFAIRFLMSRFGPQRRRPAARQRHAVRRARGAPIPQPARLRAAGARRRRRRAARGRGGSAPLAPAGGLRRRRLRAHRQDDLHPPAGRQRHRRPERPARLHDARDVRRRQAGPAGARQRGAATDVVRVDAEVLDVASETDRQIVSVRFHGLIREEKDGVAEPVRRGLAPGEAGRRQPRVGDRRHPAGAQAALSRRRAGSCSS